MFAVLVVGTNLNFIVLGCVLFPTALNEQRESIHLCLFRYFIEYLVAIILNSTFFGIGTTFDGVKHQNISNLTRKKPELFCIVMKVLWFFKTSLASLDEGMLKKDRSNGELGYFSCFFKSVFVHFS